MFTKRKWKDATPVKREQKRWFRWHIACIYDPPTDHRLRAYVRKQKEAFYKYRRTGGPYTPYGKYAIPQYILDCESYGGSWSASNGTHVGPYSLSLSLYEPPWPVDSWADKIEHHRIAHGLWAGGSGISHWAACA